MQSEPQHLHLISDSTGETVNAMARAALARFDREPVVHLTVFVRNMADVDAAIVKMRAYRGFVLYTLADPGLRAALEARLPRKACPRSRPSIR